MAKTEVANRIRELRGHRTQHEFAQVVGVSRSYLATVESGGQEPSAEMVKAIHEATNANPVWIWKGTGPKYLHDPVSSKLPKRSAAEKDTVFRYMIGLPQKEVPSLARAETGVLRDSGAAMVAEASAIYGKPKPARRHFGYAGLPNTTEVRLKAVLDDEIAGTALYYLAREESYWKQLEGITGPEFEKLRAYMAAVGSDVKLETLVGVLNYIRLVEGK